MNDEEKSSNHVLVCPEIPWHSLGNSLNLLCIGIIALNRARKPRTDIFRKYLRIWSESAEIFRFILHWDSWKRVVKVLRVKKIVKWVKYVIILLELLEKIFHKNMNCLSRGRTNDHPRSRTTARPLIQQDSTYLRLFKKT